MIALDQDLKRRIKAITNVFEVGRPEPDYDYVENLDDGRGFTVTHYGFCTYNDEVTKIIERYSALRPDNALKQFMPKLPPSSDDGRGLGAFARVWRSECGPALAQACDDVAEELYLKPALALAAEAGVSSPIGLAIFYDTMIQHGDGEDADGLPAIMKMASSSADGGDYLGRFLAVREQVLAHSHDPETRDVWRQSRGRVVALRKLLSDNPQLMTPIRIDQGDDDVIEIR